MFTPATLTARLRSGIHPRKLLVEIQGGPPDQELAPQQGTLKDQLEAFTRIVRLGGFARVSGDASFAILDGAAPTRRVSIVLPPVPEAALRPLWHMTAFSGASTIAITEECDDLVAACSLADPIRTHASFPFELHAAESKGLSLSLVLGTPNARDALRAIVPLVEACRRNSSSSWVRPFNPDTSS